MIANRDRIDVSFAWFTNASQAFGFGSSLPMMMAEWTRTPISNALTEKLYRTGWMARVHPSGCGCSSYPRHARCVESPFGSVSLMGPPWQLVARHHGASRG